MNYNDLFNMGGYELYVWSAYLITLIVFLLNLLMALREKKQIKKIPSHYES